MGDEQLVTGLGALQVGERLFCVRLRRTADLSDEEILASSVGLINT